MVRILKHICVKERIALPLSTIQHVVENAAGDIRSAINALQFFAINQQPSSSPVTFPTTPKKLSSSQTQTQQAQLETGILGTRDASLSLFHAIGKFMYNKRLEPDPGVDTTQPYYRNPMEFIPENVFKYVQISPPQFNMFLQITWLL